MELVMTYPKDISFEIPHDIRLQLESDDTGGNGMGLEVTLLPSVHIASGHLGEELVVRVTGQYEFTARFNEENGGIGFLVSVMLAGIYKIPAQAKEDQLDLIADKAIVEVARKSKEYADQLMDSANMPSLPDPEGGVNFSKLGADMKSSLAEMARLHEVKSSLG
jgi:hypothetical protein